MYTSLQRGNVTYYSIYHSRTNCKTSRRNFTNLANKSGSKQRGMSKTTFFSVTIPKFFICWIVMSLLNKVTTVGIITTHMASKKSSTETEIELILDIVCIGLAPCMSIKVFIHLTTSEHVPLWCLWGRGNSKKLLPLYSTRKYQRRECLNLSKLSSLLVLFLNYNLQM